MTDVKKNPEQLRILELDALLSSPKSCSMQHGTLIAELKALAPTARAA